MAKSDWNDKMKKVLFVISYLDKGGAERALSNITMNMPDDWECDILVNSDKVIDYPYKANIITLNIGKEAKTDSILFQFSAFIRRVTKLHKLKRVCGYTACISFLDSANIANILSGNRYCKTIVSIRSSMIGRARVKQYKYLANPMVRMTYNFADKVVAVSRGITQELVSQYGISPNKVKTIENGYNLNELKRMASEEISRDIKEFAEGKLLVITSGRLTHEKGQWHLIRAFSEVAKRIPNVGLIILGDGPLSSYLNELVVEYHLEGKVIFPGFVSNPYSILAKADIFVLSSVFEGFPNAMAEALCLGIPCIATDFPTGARELLAPDIIANSVVVDEVKYEEYGIITPICSGERYKGEPLEKAEELLEEAICKLCVDEELRRHYSEKSYERSGDLEIANVIKQWIEVMEAHR